MGVSPNIDLKKKRLFRAPGEFVWRYFVETSCIARFYGFDETAQEIKEASPAFCHHPNSGVSRCVDWPDSLHGIGHEAIQLVYQEMA